MPEMIDIYNEERELTGQQLPRKTKLGKGQFMLYVLALLQNQEGKFLITRRALDKKWAAGAWEIPGGGASAGETSRDALNREILEETGLDVSGADAEVIYSYRNEDLKSGDNYFADIYLCRLNFSEKDAVLQKEEAIDMKLASFEEITELQEKDGFLHYERICQALQKK